MSTPHTLPPARVDARLDKIYARNRRILFSDPTPIVSLCGGATDMMIPSESCILPAINSTDIARRTVFTSALEGAWTGVGHREMVWCHQVRWRVARAALEAAGAVTAHAKAALFDKWLRDGHTLPPAESLDVEGFTLTNPNQYRTLDEAHHLVIPNKLLFGGTMTHLLPLPPARKTQLKAVVYVGQGSILSVGPHNSGPAQVSVHMCIPSDTGPKCSPLKPSLLKLIPNPLLGAAFPALNEGVDESDGAAVFEADIPLLRDGDPVERWLGVHVANANGRGWVVGGIALDERVHEAPTMLCRCSSLRLDGILTRIV
ncbi:hypothetical protein H0H93_010810 [Arthromyces matolae]|nr:hypothetical protein H0H93_010810 [Arthromyces matolae]